MTEKESQLIENNLAALSMLETEVIGRGEEMLHYALMEAFKMGMKFPNQIRVLREV